MDNKVTAYLDRYQITEQSREFLAQPQKMYIGGEWVEASDGETIEVLEPCTGGSLTKTPAASIDDVDMAVSAAEDAFSHEWRAYTAADREKLLWRIADLVEKNAQTLAEIESINTGKALQGCLDVDIAGSIDLLRYMAGWPTKIEGATRPISIGGEHFGCTIKQPIGVVGAIVPWNWPFNMAIWKIAAPLAAGCCLVVKPAQQTPLSLLYFARLCEEAGLPAGVLNVVTGSGSRIGSHLTSHTSIRKISFTGSTEVGRQVGAAASKNLAHLTLELGGKSPMVMFEDGDIDRLVAATQQSIFFNAGQVCSGGSRLYVHESIYEEVIEAIVDKVLKMKLAPGLDPDCDMGPIISREQRDNILEYIEVGKAEGARLVCGGAALAGDGYFIQPTVFADCKNEMRIVQEEIFGPVLVILPFQTEQEAIKLANDNQYGLAASVFTRDISRAFRLVESLDAGTVWVNTHDLVDSNLPFGGFKNSGLGKDLGPEQLDHFLETKTMWIEL